MSGSKTDLHATCPYRTLPPEAYWSRSVSRPKSGQVNPALKGGFLIDPAHKIATAGSCFAQHIARFLAKNDYNYFITEGTPASFQDVAGDYNYGTFSARYGNVYTTRQLRQLLERAYGLFEPVDTVWQHGDRYFDPLRPQIQPEGFSSNDELKFDRAQHLGAVRRMVEELDVFVFTLGLTEAWVSKVDGTVFPVCPGCGAGEHDKTLHEFRNFTVSETLDDLISALSLIRDKNPSSCFILTVSPVPLIATASDNHVLTATTYSKAVLRVAAEDAATRLDRCDYFPSYEIITGSYNKGAYFEADLRSVKPEGVSHVMDCFSKAYFTKDAVSSEDSRARNESLNDIIVDHDRSQLMNDIICDEEVLLR